MRELILNSHSLSDYQRCPELYRLCSLRQLRPQKPYAPFERGTLISEMLAEYYTLCKDGNLTPRNVLELINRKLETASPDAFPQSESYEEKVSKHLLETRFMQYYGHYKHDPLFKVLAVETGFSYELYCDSEVRFIYEGKPDLVAVYEDELAIMDHKHQTRKAEYYAHNNQTKGYCCATGARRFFYNYFGVQHTGTKELWFRRSLTKFTEDQIDMWKRDTIKWYYKVLNDTEYLKSLRCEERYGECVFTEVCETPHDFIKEALIQRNFKVEPYKSW